MRWVCPGCGSQVSVALSQCPSCGSSEASAPSPPAHTANSASPATSEFKLADVYPPASAPAERPASTTTPTAPAQRLLPTPRPADEDVAEPENPYWRGVKFGIGFMFAVAMILLLLAMLLPWLQQQGWQPWLDTASP